MENDKQHELEIKLEEDMRHMDELDRSLDEEHDDDLAEEKKNLEVEISETIKELDSCHIPEEHPTESLDDYEIDSDE